MNEQEPQEATLVSVKKESDSHIALAEKVKVVKDAVEKISIDPNEFKLPNGPTLINGQWI